MSDTAHEIVTRRLEEAGLATDRFVTVKDGEKMCLDHDSRWGDAEAVRGTNYGIYADGDDQLFVLDVDDHDGDGEEVSSEALTALLSLGETLQQESPHRGDHRLYRLAGDTPVAEVLRDRLGTKNPVPSWGEVQAGNKYVVGAGSQLDGCDKDWCDRCATAEGGRYEVKNDAPVATVTADDLVKALAADPELSRTGQQHDITDIGETGTSAGSDTAEADANTGSTGQDADAEDDGDSAEPKDADLSREEVEDLLAEIPGDQHFDDWIRTGYAVHAWDDGPLGKQVFAEWSRKNEDYEADESERQIDYIWSEGDSNGDEQGNAGVGTLVYMAHGDGDANRDTAKPPEKLIAEHSEKYDSAAEVPPLGADSPESTAPDWGEVRGVYEAAAVDDHTPKGAARKKAKERLEADTTWMHVLESEKLWRYDADSGTYEEYGEAKIGEELETELGQHYSITERREIVDRLKQSNWVHRRELNAREYEGTLLCVGNGVVNFDTGELLDHDPAYRFVRGLSVDLPTEENGLESDRSGVIGFLNDVTKRRADRDTLLDHLAHGLMPGHPYRAFVVTFGPGGNGKTQVARLFKGFVGEANAAAVEIDELVNDDFATGDLPGKFINWGDDMSGDGGGTLQELSTLKKASGGSTIRANAKYEKTYDFQNEAAMFFSANEPPRMGEVKPSVKDRLYPIEMPYRFVRDADPDDPLEKEKEPNIADRLLADEAVLRGLLEVVVEHGKRLRENSGEYSMPEGPDERYEIYNQEADPLTSFARMALEPAGPDMKLRKDDVYRVYQNAMDEWEDRAAGERGFKRQLPRSVSETVETAQSRELATPDDDDERVRCWKRLTWADEARSFMPDWIEARYSDHFSTDTKPASPTEPTDAKPDLLTPADLEGLEAADREKLPPVRGTVLGVWENRYGKPEAELAGEDGTTVDVQVVGYEMPATTPLSGGSEYELEGLRYRAPDDGRPYVELRPTTAVRGVEAPPEPDEDDGGDEDGDAAAVRPAEPDASPPAPASDDGSEAAETATDGGPPTDAEGPRADAQRLREALHRERATTLEDAVPKAGAAQLADVPPDDFDAALKHGTSKMVPAPLRRAERGDKEVVWAPD